MKNKLINLMLMISNIIFCLNITGCGQSGPLVLPNQQKPTATNHIEKNSDTTNYNGRYSNTPPSSSPNTVT